MARKGRNGLTLRVGVPSFRSARQHRACDAPYIRTEDAESGVLLHYASLLLPGGFAARVREVLAATLADEERSVRLVHEHLTKRLAELDAKETTCSIWSKRAVPLQPRYARGSRQSLSRAGASQE